MNENKVIENTKHIYGLANYCVQKGVRFAVICPGSRNAALTIAFAKQKYIRVISITDERSAGFIAMGIAQQTKNAVVLICSSGTAGLNFAPAVTEAFYQNIPLIVLTADRPKEWIDQWDGQTIHQENMFSSHIKSYLSFEKNTKKQDLEKVFDKSFPSENTAKEPIHLNIPIEKPFYPNSKEDILTLTNYKFVENITKVVNKELKETNVNIKNFIQILLKSKSVLIFCGQNKKNDLLNLKLKTLQQKFNIPSLGDVISNNQNHCLDEFFNINNKELLPELLITIGKSTISENTKLYFRKNKSKQHFHIGLGLVGNPFLTDLDNLNIISADTLGFFESLIKKLDDDFIKQINYLNNIKKRTKQVVELNNLEENKSTNFNQLSVTKTILETIKPNSNLHLGNSLTVRLANKVGFDYSKNIEVFLNRGTSGIDGCLSTAIGHSIADKSKQNYLIIGDISFFYDINGLWINEKLPNNLVIFVINNNGGEIFKKIKGPKNQGKTSSGLDIEELFTTPHNRSVKRQAKEFKLITQK